MTELAPWFADIASFEKALGLQEEFIVNLLKEDDWSFVIKSQALIETVLTQILIAKVDPRMGRAIGKMNLMGGRASKIQAAVDLDVLSKSMLQVITVFSEIRNEFVHNPRFLNGSLSNYFRNQNNGKIKQFLSSILSLFGNEQAIVSEIMLKEFVNTPKQVLCITVLYILGHLILHANPVQKEQIDQMLEEHGLAIGLLMIGVIIFGIYQSGRSNENDKSLDEP